ncbi:DivIVA domain-containing protein [Micromonospora echinofusca]|uniref:DivIVA domain-containing protein n=1 Tax=Micromonospora echinofusca TaxID=47858 RepID=A0ABS3VKZ3_MICEH|nr:DivIVA domain-containing protein [Micromonospora echinofusca]
MRRLLSTRHRPGHRRYRPPETTADAVVDGRTGYPPLRPWQVRERCFNHRRQGLDPTEVTAFLHRVAGELAVAQTALAAVREENTRIKDALRAWQSAQAPSAYELAGR